MDQVWSLMSNFLYIDFAIKVNAKKSQRFDLNKPYYCFTVLCPFLTLKILIIDMFYHILRS